MKSRDTLPTVLYSRIHWAKMLVYTWEDPELYQRWTVNQVNQKDWPKETRKKCPL